MLSYYDNVVICEFPKAEKNQIKVGKVLLTQVGRQLVGICGAQPVPGFFEHVLRKWVGENVAIASRILAIDLTRASRLEMTSLSRGRNSR